MDDNFQQQYMQHLHRVQQQQQLQQQQQQQQHVRIPGSGSVSDNSYLSDSVHQQQQLSVSAMSKTLHFEGNIHSQQQLDTQRGGQMPELKGRNAESGQGGTSGVSGFHGQQSRQNVPNGQSISRIVKILESGSNDNTLSILLQRFTSSANQKPFVLSKQQVQKLRHQIKAFKLVSTKSEFPHDLAQMFPPEPLMMPILDHCKQFQLATGTVQQMGMPLASPRSSPPPMAPEHPPATVQLQQEYQRIMQAQNSVAANAQSAKMNDASLDAEEALQKSQALKAGIMKRQRQGAESHTAVQGKLDAAAQNREGPAFGKVMFGEDIEMPLRELRRRKDMLIETRLRTDFDELRHKIMTGSAAFSQQIKQRREKGESSASEKTGAPMVEISALVRLKSIQVARLQHNLRKKIWKSHINDALTQFDAKYQSKTPIAATKAKAFKVPRLTARAQKGLERQKRLEEKAARKEQARKEREKLRKHKEYISSILKHVSDFKEFHKSRHEKTRKIGVKLKDHFVKKARAEQLAAEKKEKDRIKALREEDEETYMKLLEETKNDRLTHLLRQTEDFLRKIGDLVKLEKESVEVLDDTVGVKQAGATTDWGDASLKVEHMMPKEVSEEKEQSGYLATKRNYYKTAHSVLEDVEQPSWLDGGTLKPYQLASLKWLVSLYNNNLNGILADEMGLGKTIQTVALIVYLMQIKKNNGPYLIIVPLSTIDNWAFEFQKWCPIVSVVVYRGSQDKRAEMKKTVLANQKFNVLLTTYEFVLKDAKHLSKTLWQYIIIDEGHRIKNVNSKLSVTLGKMYRAKHRLLLTGTPLQNSLHELWALLNFLLPTIFSSVDSFEQWFDAGFTVGMEKVEMSEEETLLVINRLHEVLRPFLLRRVKKEVESQLPDKKEWVVKCDLSAWQKHLYRQVTSGNRRIAQSGSVKRSGQTLNNTIMQLRKICNHPYLMYDDLSNLDFTQDLVRSAGKFELLDRMLTKLHSQGHKVLIFSQMVNLLDLMTDYFIYREFKFLRLDGGTASEDRQKVQAEFNRPGSDHWVFMLSTRAGGLGLNLQAADTVIIFDSDWNPQMDLQAQDRAHRIGQKNEVRVYRFITRSVVEEQMLARANYKLQLDQKIIQEGKFNQQSVAEESRKDLLERILVEDNDDNDENESDELDDDQLNLMLARSDEELEAYRKMDENATASGPGKKARLMEEKELPQWVTAMPIEEETFEEAALNHSSYGSGKRDRKAVVYNVDNMTDKQFDKMLDSGEFQPEKFVSRPKAKSRASSPVANGGAPSAIKGRGKKNGVEDEEDAAKRQELISKLLAKICDAITSEKDETDRQRAELFIQLPTRRELPEYFAVISKPVDLVRAQTKARKGQYKNIDAVKADLDLMWKNAREFNEEGSEVFGDSLVLEEVANRSFDEFSVEYEEEWSAYLTSKNTASGGKKSKSQTGFSKKQSKNKHKGGTDSAVQSDVDEDLQDSMLTPPPKSSPNESCSSEKSRKRGRTVDTGSSKKKSARTRR